MRWFKHLSHASEGRFLSRLLIEFGPEGYGVFWLVLEAIAAGMDQSDRVTTTKTIRGWAVFCHVSIQKLRKILGYCQDSGKFKLEYTGALLSISCPNLLKYRDESTRKLRKASGTVPGQSPDELRHRIEEKRQEEKRRDGASGIAPDGLGAPELPGAEDKEAGKALLADALRKLGVKPDNGTGSHYIDRDDPDDLILIAKAAALGIEVHEKTPKATLLALIEAKARKGDRITPRGEKY